MKKVVIRTDSSECIGSGHITRCRTLAREMQRMGIETIFMCMNLNGNMIGVIEKEFRVIIINPADDSRETHARKTMDGKQVFDERTDCKQIRDAKECISAMEINEIINIDFVIVDHYGLDEKWEDYIKQKANNDKGCKIMVIDDLGDRKHNCEIYVNQNYIRENEIGGYMDKIPNGCITKLGPKYALLSKEYELLHEVIPRRKEVGRIMIYFGGVDEYNYTIKAIKAMMTWDLRNIKLDAVLGQIKNNEGEITELSTKRGNITLHKNLKSLAGLMIRADLSIGAGGSTTWERACLGLPSIVIATAENQLKTSSNLDEDGYHYLIGTMNGVTESDIRRKVRWLKKNEMTDKSSQLTDGKGASRIVELFTNGVQ